jgi:hypothetical protein
MIRVSPFSSVFVFQRPLSSRFTTMFCGSKGTSETRRFAMNFFSMKHYHAGKYWPQPST